jgi:hypothetical protein
MTRILITLLIILNATASFAAGSKTFGAHTPTGLPATGQQRSAEQLTARFNDLLDHINEIFDLSLAANYNKFLKFDVNGEVAVSDSIATDNGISLTGTDSTNHGDILYVDTNGTLVFLAPGASGQKLQTNGVNGNPSWVTLAATNAWEQKTTNFTTGDGGRYKVTSGVNTITLHAPGNGSVEFYIKPEVGNDLAANQITLNGAMQVAGGAATSYTLDQAAVYHFTTDGTDYDVSAAQIER